MLAQITANDQTAKREGVLVPKANVDLKDDRIDDIEDVRSYIGEYRKKPTRYAISNGIQRRPRRIEASAKPSGPQFETRLNSSCFSNRERCMYAMLRSQPLQPATTSEPAAALQYFYRDPLKRRQR